MWFGVWCILCVVRRALYVDLSYSVDVCYVYCAVFVILCLLVVLLWYIYVDVCCLYVWCIVCVGLCLPRCV